MNEFYFHYIYANLPQIIIGVIVVWITFRIYRFFTIRRVAWYGKTTSNPKMHDLDNFKPGSIPPHYPNLWYPVIQNQDLKAGQVKPLYFVGKDLVVYRTRSGKVHVLDAFCPHMGSHLGVCGSVVGEDIKCPFHGWTFNGEGVCTSVPGLQPENIPKTGVKRWKTFEANDYVYIWYHKDDQEPNWEPKVFHELIPSNKSGDYVTHFGGHFVDLLSNIPDPAHFVYMHTLQGQISAERVLRKETLYKFITKFYRYDFTDHTVTVDENDKLNLIITLNITPIIFGIPITSLTVDVKCDTAPPAQCLRFTFRNFNVTMTNLIMMTPFEPFRSLMVNNFYHQGTFISKILTRFFMFTTIAGLEGEQIIMDNKTTLANPCFSSIDKGLVKFFRWFKQNFL